MSKRRLNLSLNEELDKKIEELMKRTGARTKAEFFNYAVAMYDWAISAVGEGKSIAAIDRDTNQVRELEMPPLRLARRGRKGEEE